MNKKIFIFVLFVHYLLSSCVVSETVIPSKKIDAYNKKINDKIWRLKKNIYSPLGDEKKLIFRKNQRLQLTVHVGSSWVIVRALKYKQNRENTLGKTILYLYPLKKKQFTIDDLDQRIREIAR